MAENLYALGMVLLRNNDAEWVDCVINNDFEICTTYPYSIRKKSWRIPCVLSESETTNGYIQVFMNRKCYLKHKVIAQQFIPNPYNYRYVRHKNFNTTDNHIDNLIWCKSSHGVLI